jgi:hypothetical protein
LARFASRAELAELHAPEGRVLRHFASAIVIAAAACASAPAHATEFLSAIEDVPLPKGLAEAPEPMIFESDQGRVVRTSAEGHVRTGDVAAFYAASLPQLGWMRMEDAQALAFARENETLRITMREPASNTPVTVSFELIVKLASSRLPD